MESKYCLTTIGKDQPGIVSTVTKVLFDNNCNIEDSSMALLGGEFAIILVLSTGTNTDIEALKTDLYKIKDEQDLTINLNELKDFAEPNDTVASNYTVHVYGADRPGIVYKTCEILSDNKVNIIDLSTKVIRGEVEVGSEVYLMLIEIDIPSDVSAEAVREELKELADELDVTVEMHEVEVFEEL